MSKSSTEAEFCALSGEIDEVLWIRGILKELKIPLEEPIKILSDNKSIICIAHDIMHHDWIKQCTDSLTQGLPNKNFTKLISKLGMRSLHSCT